MSTYNFEQLLVANELGEVIRLHNQAIEQLKNFRESHPALIAPNLARMAEENLKENVSVLYRELNNLHKPKTEQRRHVCRECYNVFVVPLPGGICDECRSKISSPGNAYDRPQMPEAESETLSDATPIPADSLPVSMDGEEMADETVSEGIAVEAPVEGDEVSETLIVEADAEPAAPAPETENADEDAPPAPQERV